MFAIDGVDSSYSKLSLSSTLSLGRKQAGTLEKDSLVRA